MRNEAGFTLIEVLVAFVLLVITLGVVYGRLSLSLHAMTVADDHSRAALQAEHILTELGRSRPLTYGTSEGDLPGGAHWRLVIAPTTPRQSGAVSPRLEGHNVTLSITWEERGRSQSKQFSTVRLGMEH